MSRKTLLVACGGSGIKTLMRFNEMMSGNAEWKKRLPKDVAYLIIDTEVALTKTFEETVSAQLGGAKGSAMPLIRLVQITKGFNSLDELVEPAFYERGDVPGFDRLRPHWWFSPDGKKPFCAQYVQSLEQGAGQCAPVSYLCTWNSLPQFEKTIDDLLSKLKQRNTDEDNPLEDMHVYFVAGLAGGTGRGTWCLSAFKVRKYLEDRGHKINPSGIFFERGCYPNVGISDADMDVGMKVNSITGLSELSAWMRVHEGQVKYCYNLPNLMRPDPDGDTDVIRNSETGLSDFKRSPLNSAYLICKDNGYGGLENNTQYHEMAAAALYTLVAGSQFVGPTAINKLKNFGSLAANTFEVNTVRLRAYFEAYLRKAAVDAVREKATKGSALDIEANEMLKGLEDEDHPLHGMSAFAVNAPVGMTDIAATAVGKGTIVQRVIANLRSGRANVQNVFEKELDKQKPKEAWQHVSKVLSLGDVTKDRVVEAIDAAFADLKIDDLETNLREIVKAAYASDGRRASLGRSIAVVGKLNALYAQSIANLNARIVYGKDVYAQDKDLLVRFKPDFDEKAGIDWFKSGHIRAHFTSEEIKYLGNKFSWLYNCALFFKARPILQKRFEEAQKSLARIQEVCDQLVKTLQKVQNTFAKQAEKNGGGRKGETAYRSLFTAEDSQSMLTDIPLAADVGNVYRRVLKPIMSIESMEALLLADGSSSRRDAAINKTMTDEFGKLLDLPGLPDADMVEELESTLELLFTSNVFLHKDFMDTNFSFAGILKSNIEHWNRLIGEVYGNMSKFEELRTRFIEYLGVDLSADEEEDGAVREMIPTIKWPGLIRKIVVSLVGTCKPWVELDKQVSKKYLETMALLPVSLDRNSESEMKDAVKASHESQNTAIIHLGSASEGGYKLPTDRIVVFASQNIAATEDKQALDLVKSISYWNEPRVMAALELAERADSKAYFKENKMKSGYVERERGLGFVSPIYVNESKLAATRWHPWRPEETVDAVEERLSAIDKALLYAFLGVDAKAAEKTIVADVADRFGWQMPLLEMGNGKAEDFTFSREPLVWENGRGEEDGTPAWEGGETVITSIDNLYTYLKGEGKPGLEGSKLIQAQESGRRQLEHLLAEADAFWKNIVPEIGATAFSKLATARNKWLTARERAASKDDKPFWKRLQQAAKAQKA